MDGAAAVACAVLKAFTASVADGRSYGNPEALDDMCRTIVERRILAEAAAQAASSKSRSQHNSAVNAWFDTLNKALQAANQAKHQQALCKLFAASITGCDSQRLILCFQDWLTLLLDMLKQQRDVIMQNIQPRTDAAATTGGKKGTAAQRANASGSPEVAAQVSLAVSSTCRAVGQIIARLGDCMEVGSVRRDVSPLVSRSCSLCISLILQAADLPVPAPAVRAALQLVSVLLNSAPTSLRNYAANLETSLSISVVTGGKGIISEVVAQATRQLAASCLILTPRIAGDAASYSTLYRRLLLSFHDVLDALYMGLDDQNAAAACKSLLTVSPSQQGTAQAGAAPATDASAPLLPLTVLTGDNAAAGSGSSKRVTPDVMRAGCGVAIALLEAAKKMLTIAYPVPVSLPGWPVLQAVQRCLSLNDGAVLASGRVASSAASLLQLQNQLPKIHAASMQLLTQLIITGGSTLLPLHAPVGRFLADQFKKLRVYGAGMASVVHGSVRRALYRLAVAACKAPSGGVTVVRIIAAEALNAVTAEMYGWTPEGSSGSNNATAMLTARATDITKPATKKAKLAAAQESSEVAAAVAAAAAVASGPAGVFAYGSSNLPCAVASLQLLVTMLAVAGPLIPAVQRARADAVAYHLAATAADAVVHARHEPGLVTRSQMEGLVCVQAAAYEALLASITAPLPTRPPFLSQAAHLFSAGLCSSSPAVAKVCRAASQALEGVVHPRATPITGVRQQYAGLSEVATLHRPHFWTALLAAQDGSVLAQQAQQQLAMVNASHPGTTHQNASAQAPSSAAPVLAFQAAQAATSAGVFAAPAFGQAPTAPNGAASGNAMDVDGRDAQSGRGVASQQPGLDNQQPGQTMSASQAAVTTQNKASTTQTQQVNATGQAEDDSQDEDEDEDESGSQQEDGDDDVDMQDGAGQGASPGTQEQHPSQPQTPKTDSVFGDESSDSEGPMPELGDLGDDVEDDADSDE